jgi:cytolysin-activating lysine-acyltransferase
MDDVEADGVKGLPVNNPRDICQVLGIAVTMLEASSYHRGFRLYSVGREFLPPIAAGQCRVYVDTGNRLVGIVTWAWIEDAVRDRLLSRGHGIAASEWSAGNNLHFNDFVAPWGHAKAIFRDLSENVFPRVDVATSVRRRRDGSVRKVNTWRRNKPLPYAELV